MRRPRSDICSRRPRAPATGSPPSGTSANGRPWPSARAPTTRSRSPSRATSPTCSCSPCARGRIEERRSHYLENAEVEGEDTLLARFLLEYYDTQVGIPPLVCVHTEVADSDLIAGFLSERRGATVELRVAERGDKRRVVSMARRNAELGVRHDVLRSQRTRTRRIEGLEELREALNLEALPIRIECFDISNLQDTNAVASMVVFEDGAAKRSEYRRFGIRHARRAGRLPLARGGRHAALRAPPARRRGRLRPQLRDAPEPARDRRRQGTAGRGAGRDAHLRPAARGGRLAGQARGGGLPARTRPARAAAARVAGPAVAAAGARRGPPLRAARAPHAQGRGPDRIAARHAAGRRRRAPPRADRALRRRRAPARGLALRARGGTRGTGGRRAQDLRPPPSRRAATDPQRSRVGATAWPPRPSLRD